MANPNSPDPYGPCNPDDEDLLTQYKPLLRQLSISSIVGYCSGVTAKRVGKSLAFIAGLGFVALQALAHKGFVTVDWKKVQKSALEKLDTVSSARSVTNLLSLPVLTNHLPTVPSIFKPTQG